MQAILKRMEMWDTQKVLYILVAMALVSLGFSAFSHWMSGDVAWWAWAEGAGQNFSTEMIGAIITFGLFELVVGTRSEKKNLILQLGSSDNITVRNTVRQLRVNGWLYDGTLHHISLESANLENINLERINLYGSNLENANFQQADLREANLQLTNLSYANLRQALLREANMQQADLLLANLQKAYLRDTNLCGCKNIQSVQFDAQTILPDASIRKDKDGNFMKGEDGNLVYDKYWTPDTDMTRYTDPNHPNFWQPEWAKGDAS